MNDCCPLCCQDLNGVTFYVRWFEGRYDHCLTKDIIPFKGMAARAAVTVNGKIHKNVDIVNMLTGKVFRNDLKRALPDWLKEPVKRGIIAATGELPLIYKNSKVEKASRKPLTPATP